jgi:hypothetical protein
VGALLFGWPPTVVGICGNFATEFGAVLAVLLGLVAVMLLPFVVPIMVVVVRCADSSSGTKASKKVGIYSFIANYTYWNRDLTDLELGSTKIRYYLIKGEK